MNARNEVPPSSWVTKYSTLLKPRSRVLDLACGSGRHTCFFAAQGHVVTAVDKNIGSLSGVESYSDVEVVRFDLESGRWPFVGRQFDCVVITNYLHRPLFADIINALSPDGLLIYETFMVGNEQFGRPSSSDFLLEVNELLTVFSEKLKILAYQSGKVKSPKVAVVQRICATPLRDDNGGDHIVV